MVDSSFSCVLVCGLYQERDVQLLDAKYCAWPRIKFSKKYLCVVTFPRLRPRCVDQGNFERMKKIGRFMFHLPIITFFMPWTPAGSSILEDRVDVWLITMEDGQRCLSDMFLAAWSFVV